MKSHDRGLDLEIDSRYPKGKNYLLRAANLPILKVMIQGFGL